MPTEQIVVVELVSVQWMLGIIVVSGGTGMITIVWLLRLMKIEQAQSNKGIIKLLVEVGKTNIVVGEVVRTQKAMIHYTRWTAQEMTGKVPPPPIGD